MPREKVSFKGHAGDLLAGMLELPEGETRTCALFAHCFTCSKDIAAASRIARALTQQGIAVLRFDFTGLGNSDGDFANTNFSSNVADLISASDFMRSKYLAPTILIGHSLGGAAVLMAAPQIDSVKAVVTIGAPASAQHVEHLFSNDKQAILANDEATVSLGNRQFNIKKQFLEDLQNYSSTEPIRQINKALLIFHSPVDETVSIDEAARIYRAAKHPKSFISLDKADHLLTRKEDSEYVSVVIAAWVSRFLELGQTVDADKKPTVSQGEVVITESNHRFGRNVFTPSHALLADEPTKVGGDNAGPNPYELLLASLGSCTSMTLRMYANRKKLPLDDVKITLRHLREHHTDCDECEQDKKYLDVIERDIELTGDLDDATQARLMEIADRCPVHRSLENDIVIRSKQAF